MAIPLTAAHDINTLLRYLMGQARPQEAARATAADAIAAARRLAGQAYRALGAGLTPDDVDLNGETAHSRYDGAPPTEIDGMPVRAAFPTPPPSDDSMEHWTVILAEPPGQDGSTYRVCRVRQAGAPGEWEVIAELTGAEELTWMLAAIAFADAVRVESGSD